MDQELTIYEQPLNERIRAFLRLEFLFKQATYSLHGDSIWDSRAALDAILDIVSLLSRSDLRTELIKELERHMATFDILSGNPGVDQGMLDSVLARITPLVNTLRSKDVNPGQGLRSHELMNYVRQRSSIPAGSCSFDIPAYQNWLERPLEQRQSQLAEWLDEFSLFNDAISLCLELIRTSALNTSEVAEAGFFQRSLDPTSVCQLIRVIFAAGTNCFPEISGGRHRISIRFLELDDPANRPVQTEQNINFELQCCII